MNKNSLIKEQSVREISTFQRETTENKEQITVEPLITDTAAEFKFCPL
jgi:hypothetical protein